ncbi:MAG: tetratricopeptide repeat protein [Caldilineaceae bacterium]
MRSLTPTIILDQLAEGNRQGRFPAIVLFVDSSGFTPLTSRLMEQGNEGAEIIAQVLAALFAPLVEIIYRQGGFVAGFAGDAFKAIFPGESEETRNRALNAAWQIRQWMAEHPMQTTRFGSFPFAVKISMAQGSVEWCIWQVDAASTPSPMQRQQAAVYFGGEALDQALAADPFIQAGEIILSADVAQALAGEGIALEPVASYYRLQSWPVLEETAKSHAKAQSSPRFSPESLCPVASLREISTVSQPQLSETNFSELATRFFPGDLLTRQIQGEFRRVTTLFVNLQRLPTGDEAEQFAGLLFRLLAEQGGYLCRIGQIGERDRGGTLLLFWGAPTSHERDVAAALRFVLALKATSSIPLRVGITTALAYAGFVGSAQREEYTCYGTHVNLAARQMVMAEWGEIWLDDETKRLAGSDFVIEAHKRVQMKGFAEPRQVFRLLSLQQAAQQAYSEGKLIGRQAELATLHAALVPLRQGKFAGVINVVGEAGMGKSRLVQELRQQTEGWGDVPNPQWFLCQTDEILRQPLNPFRSWLRSYFNQSTSADETTNKAVFASQLKDLNLNLSLLEGKANPQSSFHNLQSEITRTYSFLAALVDLHWPDSLYAQLEPRLRFENTLLALKSLILAESLRQPVVLHIEDGHWLDEESQTFLKQLVEGAEGYPLAVMVTRRPDGEMGRHLLYSVQGWGDKESTIHLESLASEETGALAAELLTGAASPELVALLQAKAEGNPFFSEQLLRYLQEEGLLEQGAGGWQIRTEQQASIRLPMGAQALLVARLDRLPQSVKEVVQAASILGREFDTLVLAQMLRGDPALAHKLAVADQAAIWSAINQARYLFRHALLREAAYEMQLRTQLRALHRQAAEAMQTLFAERLDPYYADLAYHYDRAEVLEMAASWYGKAGQQAVTDYANRDALRYFSRALELTPVMQADAQFDLLLGRETVYDRLGEIEAQRADLARLEEVAGTLAKGAYQAQAALRLTNHLRLQGDYKSAQTTIVRAAEFASQDNDQRLLGEIHQQWGRLDWEQGDYGTGRSHLEQAIRFAQTSQSPLGEATALVDLGVIDLYLGNYQAAKTYYTSALPIYRALGRRQGEGSALSMLGILASQTAEYELALAYLQQAQEIFVAIGDSYGLGFVWGNLGLNYSYVGQYIEAQKLLHQAIQDCQIRHQQQGESNYLDSLAVVYLHLGDYQEAYRLATRALTIQRAIHDPRFEAYSLTYQGDAFLGMGDFAAALLCYEQALAIRRQLGEEKLTLEILSGLAQVKLARGEISASLAQVTQIQRWIEQHGIEGIEFPIQLYLHCTRVLQAAGESAQAQSVLETGYQLLNERATKIQDPQLRQSFLQAVPFNRQIAEIWQNGNVTE